MESHHSLFYRTTRVKLLAAIGLWASFLAAGCTSPCRELANRICNCEFNVNAQAICTQQVEANESERGATNEENERCGELLDSCDCEDLQRGDFDQCGLVSE